MPRVHVTGGYLNVDTFTPEGPVDPGWGGGISGIHPGHDLPGAPVIPGHLPAAPPGVWPPLTPSAPVQPAPPIAGVPVPPGSIWPPIAGMPLPPSPGHPDQGLPPAPARPDQGLPTPPAHVGGGPVPPQGSTKPPSGTFWVVAGIPGVGWRYVAVDPSLVVGLPLPTPPAHASGQPVPTPPEPTPQRR